MPRRRRHLYLVTEERDKGHSIRKVDLEEHHYAADPDTDEQQQEEERLSRPPAILRLETTRDGSWRFAPAFGTKIIAVHSAPRRRLPVFDVLTRCMSFGLRMPSFPIAPFYVPIGDKLYSLDTGDFKVLRAPPPPVNPCHNDQVVPKRPSWRCLPPPPLAQHRVASHAVHPDGRTIFVSVDVEGRDVGDTFTFDTAARAPKWRARREWQLPFRGPAHYDRELDAWVGLASDPAWPANLGHLSCCEAPSAEAGVQWQPPAWKISKEKVFGEGPDETQTGAALVYLGMGCRSRFCLVQCLSVGERRRRVVRLTTFSLKYDKDGDLRTSTRRRVRTFPLPKAVMGDSEFLKNPVAFWM